MSHHPNKIIDTNSSLALGLIKISGHDAFSFLQGQLSNDINELNKLSQKHWQYSGYCNPKGRLIALLQIWCEGDELFALLSKDLIESTVKRLRMYVMRSKVEIEVFAQVRCFGFSSAIKLNSLVSGLSDNLDGVTNGVNSNGDLSVLAVGQRYLLVDKVGHLENTIPENTILEKITNAPNWLAEQIVDGLPDVSQGSSELFIPQMLNLDLLDGINFKKGCYTGQEIVARMHYLGKLKQRMFVCELMGHDGIEIAPIKAGDSIYSDIKLTKSAGTVVSAASDSNVLLAVLRLTNLEQTHYLSQAISIKVAAQQPYEIPLAVES